MERRYRGLKGNVTFFLMFLVLAIACHLVPLEVIRLRLSLYPIPLIIVIYLGYKMGKWVGLAAGLLAPLPWFVIGTAVAIETGAQPNALYVLDDRLQLAGAEIVGISLQHILFGAFLGFASGKLFDSIEKRLAKANISLDELLPVKRGWVLLAIYRYLQRWFVLLSEGLLKDGRESLKDILVRQLGRLANVFVIIILAVLNLNFSDWLGLSSGDGFEPAIRSSFPPYDLASALILAYAFATGSRSGVLATVALWVATIALITLTWMGGLPAGITAFMAKVSPTLSLTADAAGMATRALTKGMEGRSLAFVITSPAQVAGLAILAWWIGKAGEIYRDDDRLSKLKAVWPGPEGAAASKPAPSFFMVLVVVFLTLTISLGFGPFEIYFDSVPLLFLAAAIWAHRYDPIVVSNRIFWTLLFFSMISPTFWYGPLGLSLQLFSVYNVFLLALIPFAVARLDLSRRGNCRRLAYGFLLATTLFDLYLAERFPHTYIVGADITIGPSRHVAMYLLSWPLTILLTELAARLLHRIASRTSRRSEA